MALQGCDVPSVSNRFVSGDAKADFIWKHSQSFQHCLWETGWNNRPVKEHDKLIPHRRRPALLPVQGNSKRLTPAVQ